MRFIPIELPGAFLLRPEPFEDERGSFSRLWCREEFANRGLDARLAQTSTSYNRRRGTLRGLHYQAAPHAEAKAVFCMRGEVFDVIVDLRRESPSYGRWFSTLLRPGSDALYVPEGVAHGFQTLEDETLVLYSISVPYVASAARGVRWNDPRLKIPWPVSEPIMSERDRQFGDLDSTTPLGASAPAR